MIANLHIFNDFSVHYNIDVTNKKKIISKTLRVKKI